jgi:hypothetical protein
MGLYIKREVKMGIFDFLFGQKNKKKGTSKKSYDENLSLNMIQNIEILENKISIDDKYFGDKIKFTTDQSKYIGARTFFLESFDMNYKQFIINERDSIIGFLKYDLYEPGYESKIDMVPNIKGDLPPFLPFIEQAIGFFHNSWPQSIKIKCYFCHVEKTFLIDIIKVQKLILFMEIPYKKEIIGWRVSEVKSFMGTGSPVNYAEGWGGNKRYLWQNIFDKKIACCMNCSNKLKELKRPQELLDSLIF